MERLVLVMCNIVLLGGHFVKTQTYRHEQMGNCCPIVPPEYQFPAPEPLLGTQNPCFPFSVGVCRPYYAQQMATAPKYQESMQPPVTKPALSPFLAPQYTNPLSTQYLPCLPCYTYPAAPPMFPMYPSIFPQSQQQIISNPLSETRTYCPPCYGQSQPVYPPPQPITIPVPSNPCPPCYATPVAHPYFSQAPHCPPCYNPPVQQLPSLPTPQPTTVPPPLPTLPTFPIPVPPAERVQLPQSPPQPPQQPQPIQPSIGCNPQCFGFSLCCYGIMPSPYSYGPIQQFGASNG